MIELFEASVFGKKAAKHVSFVAAQSTDSTSGTRPVETVYQERPMYASFVVTKTES
jgi:hypothetical protein